MEACLEWLPALGRSSSVLPPVTAPGPARLTVGCFCPARVAIASLPVLMGSIVHSIYLVLYPGVFVLVYGQSNPN